MEKVNGVPIYWLGFSNGALNAQLTAGAKISTVLPFAFHAKHNLDFLINQPQALQLSRDAARRILSAIDDIIIKKSTQDPDLILSEDDRNRIYTTIYDFQAVLSLELPQANIFYITPQRAYNMTVLLNTGENLLSQDTLNNLGSSKADVIKDMREAAKCLAFSLSTAVGFHVYRAVEAVIVKDYFAVLSVTAKERGKNNNLGNYIKILENKKVDIKIITMLQHLKDHYRNPISHPEEYWDVNKSENALGIAISALNIMVQDIQELRKRSAP